jgi:hypothetical protein
MKKWLIAIKTKVNTPAFKKQVFRAVRLFAFTMIPLIAGLFKTHNLTAHAVGAASVAALEVVFRAFYPEV